MKKYTEIEIKNNLDETAKDFLALLLDKKIVSGVLTQRVSYDKNSIVQNLVFNPEELSDAKPFAPVIPVNTSRLVSRITKKIPVKERVAAVLKPCETRAVIELTKLKQIDLSNILLITTDCIGRVKNSIYKEINSKNSDILKEIKENWKTLDYVLDSCKTCSWINHNMSDISLGFLGSSSLVIEANTEKGEAVLKELGYSLKEEENKAREDALLSLKEEKLSSREEKEEEYSKEFKGVEGLMNAFSSCIDCHNCMSACPICFCKSCFFESDTFRENDPNFILEKSEKLGSSKVPLPSETLLFHLGRMSHIGTACVECGTCYEACPVEIRLDKIFPWVSRNAQKVFDYESGRTIDETPPLMTFVEDELKEYID